MMFENSQESGVKNNEPQAKVLTVEELLSNRNLRIPDYQRPYKWDIQNVNQFINDLMDHVDKDQYRIGNMVVHINEFGEHDIVDGQQRFLTLVLICKAIYSFQSTALNSSWENVSYFLNGDHFKFSNSITQDNLYQNYQVIVRHSSDLYKIRDFIINRVELVQFLLTDQSEAFQFFDSQNARGRELYPHDLLKAFHLREFPEDQEHAKEDVVEVWEEMESEELADLFEHYLYRIRRWSRGEKAWQFSKNDIGWFKGINIDRTRPYPYINSHRLVHNRIDDISEDLPTFFGNRKYMFPFQLDELIINGRRFFEMISVYKSLIDSVKEGIIFQTELDSIATEILKIIHSYNKSDRTGDTYVRNLFYATLIYYIDRFGNYGLSDAIKRLFVWSYRLRLKMFAVRVETIINHAQEGYMENDNTNAFRVIGSALDHTEIRNLINESIESPQREIPEILDIMEKLNVQIRNNSNHEPQ